MKEEKSDRQVWLRFFLLFGSFSVLYFFVFYFCNKMLNHTNDALFFLTPNSAYWVYYSCSLIYGLATWGVYVSIKNGIQKKSFREFKVGVLLVFRLAAIPLFITLPFLYLSFTNAIVMTEEEFIYGTFWSLSTDHYTWEDVTKVEIDYSIPIESNPNRSSFNGRYILHFKDGRKFDVWQNTLEGETTEVQEIDAFLQTKNIPFFVRHVPSEDTINKYFSGNADFIRDLFSR